MTRWREGLAYGALGLPLAFVALPLYVVLPSHYAATFGVPLAALGAVLLAARLLDAVADPLIGRWVDRLFAASARRAWQVMALAAVALAVGFHALFFPPVDEPARLLWWCGIGLVATYLAYSVVSVVHQSWGARLGGDERQRARIVAWREGPALAGVLLASVLPSLAGLGATTALFAALLFAAAMSLRRAVPPSTGGPEPAAHDGFRGPWSDRGFRRLLAIFVANGVAAAVPATLVLFFIRDRLQAQALEPLFLVLYFAAGAVSMPLWVRAVARLGLARAWLAGMVLAVVAFAGAGGLQAGDTAAYAAVCIASGIALGADLALPSALLAGVIQRAGQSGRAEGAYFGWWNFATKLNLALAAGLALPLLQFFGYAPGSRDAQALNALTWAYGALPCALKLVAAGLLGAWIRTGESNR